MAVQPRSVNHWTFYCSPLQNNSAKMTANANDKPDYQFFAVPFRIERRHYIFSLIHRHPGQFQFYKALSSALPSWLSRSLFVSRMLEGRYTCLTWGLSFWVTALCFSIVLSKTSLTQMKYRVKTVQKNLSNCSSLQAFSAIKLTSVSVRSLSLLLKHSRLRYFADSMNISSHYYTTIACIFFFMIA